jgi:hypothetical protein
VAVTPHMHVSALGEEMPGIKMAKMDAHIKRGHCQERGTAARARRQEDGKTGGTVDAKRDGDVRATDAERMGGVGATDAERLGPKRDSGEVM